MIYLKDILYKVSIDSVVGNTRIAVNEIQFDSRKVILNDVFVAIKGTLTDGHEYILKAAEQGAIAVICETLPDQIINGITYVKVEDSAEALALMSANFYDNPSKNLKLIGITGTNGHTTPDSLTINKYLFEMNAAGVEFCFMEVSSHGIDQKRTLGLHFTGGVFTNLTHDHLDYHETFAIYRDVKKQFFDELPATAFALVNTDDKNGSFMLQNSKAKKVTYNLLAIYATADQLGLESLEILQLLSELESVDGRFQYTISKHKVTAIVDYAHTPDALKNVLKTINDIRTKNEELITVIGAGGDRDCTKRPKMGQIASALSSKVIFTSDNPRTEDPETIIEEVTSGVERYHPNCRKRS